MKPSINISEYGIIINTERFYINIEIKEPVDVQKPEIKNTGKPSRASTGIKNCEKCGKEYKPRSNAQRFCEKCSTYKPRAIKKKRLADLEGKELDKTLQEIAERRKKPYEIEK